MNRTQGWLIVLGGVLLAAVGDLLWLYPHLPAQIATGLSGVSITSGQVGQ